MANAKNYYQIRNYQDNIYAVYPEDVTDLCDYLFKGALPEVNAWISLNEKGYDI